MISDLCLQSDSVALPWGQLRQTQTWWADRAVSSVGWEGSASGWVKSHLFCSMLKRNTPCTLNLHTKAGDTLGPQSRQVFPRQGRHSADCHRNHTDNWDFINMQNVRSWKDMIKKTRGGEPRNRTCSRPRVRRSPAPAKQLSQIDNKTVNIKECGQNSHVDFERRCVNGR